MKMIGHIPNKIFVSICILLVSACNKQLDKLPETQLSDPTYWKSANDLKLACNAIYTTLPGMETNAYDNRTDNTYGMASNEISDGSRIATASNADWTNMYAAIRKANNIIEKAKIISDDTAQINRYVGEALFFRSYFLFELVKRFGDIPLILRTFDETDTLVNAHRTNRKIVLDSALSSLNRAEKYLPTALSLPAAEYGRITSGAGTALKVRIGLFEGTWSKYHENNTAAANKYLDTAIAASQRMIVENYYHLFQYPARPDSSYFYLFQYEGEGNANKENILVRLYGQDISNNITSHSYTQSLAQGQASPTRSLLDSYLFEDGLPLGNSPLAQPQDSTLSEFQHRDPRMGMTIFNKKAWYISSLYQPTFSGTLTGYKTRKYFVSRDFNLNVSFVDNIVIRYAEILLSYAEATWERNGAITDEILNQTVNLVRERALMPALTNAFVSNHALNMLDEIRRERRVEFAIEGYHRYWDIIRWKTAEDILPLSIKGTKIFPQEQSLIPDNPPLDGNGYLIVQDASKRKFDPQRDYLSPIPTTDISNDKNLTQNPNW